jgi:hypothetical protein
VTEPARKPVAAAQPLVCACLAWYGEPPETLERCVSSLAGVADVLVALDGRWQEMPGETDRSSTEEWRAIKAAARAVGVKLKISGAGSPFESQVAKRAELMRRGAATGAAWLLVIDGDEELECDDPERARAVLEQLDHDVAHVTLHTAGVAAKQIDRGVRRIYRADAGVTVEVAHNGYRTKDDRWLHGDPLRVDLETAALELEPLMKINHHIDARPRRRQKQAATYRIARRRHRLEVWA